MVRILIVEDDPSLRVVIRMVLERAGYEIGEAANGLAALEEIAAAAPDLVIADLTMPRMGGTELIEAIRSKPEMAAIPVVLMTGHVMGVDAKGSADAVVTKPFEPEDLIRTVATLVGHARSRPKWSST